MIFNHNPYGTRSLPWSQWIVAHFALKPARIASRPTRCDSFLKDLHQYRLMECFPVLRGEWTRIARFSCAPRARHGEKRVDPDLHPPSVPPHASAHESQSEPSSIHKTPAVPRSGVLLRNTILEPRKCVLSSSNAVSISQRSWYSAANSAAGAAS